MNTKTANKLALGSNVRVGVYSTAAGGMIWYDSGVIVQLFAAVVVGGFGGGKIKKVMVSQLAVV